MRRPTLALLLGSTLLIAASPQLPDAIPPNAAPPATPADVQPGNLDLNAVDRNARAFAPEAPALAVPSVVRSPQGRSFPVAPSVVGGLPTPAYGYIHQFGSFQITTTTAEGMFMLGAKLPFPDNRRSVDFYHALLTYVGRYVDPATRISGYLYEADLGPPVADKRYFLFGDQNLAVRDPESNGVRWVVYFNGAGARVFTTTARFYRP